MFVDCSFSITHYIGLHGELIHFMHYDSFDTAITAWERRKIRINKQNIGIMLTNFRGGGTQLLDKFEKIPFPHKIVFTEKEYPEYPHAFCIKGYNPQNGRNLYATQLLNGRRYIDQFDYVDFINHLEAENE